MHLKNWDKSSIGKLQIIKYLGVHRIQPFKERQILSKYRLSDHDLEIERERQTNMDRARAEDL